MLLYLFQCDRAHLLDLVLVRFQLHVPLLFGCLGQLLLYCLIRSPLPHRKALILLTYCRGCPLLDVQIIVLVIDASNKRRCDLLACINLGYY